MEPIVLQIIPPNLSEQTVHEVTTSKLTIHDNHLEYSYDFICDELDNDLNIWKKGIRQSDDVLVMKEFIISIGTYWLEDESAWKMCIFTSGATHNLYFSDEIDCKMIANKLKGWRLT